MSEPHDVDLAVDVPFRTDSAGQIRGSAEAVDSPLLADQRVMINGSTDLHNVIVGNSGACIYTIQLTNTVGWTYRLDVWGKGPKGGGSGWIYLHFTDESGDRYELGLYSSSLKWHEVTYTSLGPGIKKIEWSPDS